MKTTQDHVLEDLLDQTDGPVTEFVIISRAAEILLIGEYHIDVITNACYDAIQLIRTNGVLPTNEF